MSSRSFTRPRTRMRIDDTANSHIRSRQRGQALIPVLFIVLILTAFAVVVSLTARREMRAAATTMSDAQAYYVARGAVNYVAAELQQATEAGATVPQLTPPPDTDANNWTQLGDCYYKVDIIDTSSRVNINIAPVASLAKLPALANDPSIACSIVDWRDSDDNPTAYNGYTGVESDYYQSLTPPYTAKNAPFDTVEELLQVNGVTPDVLYNIGASNPNPLEDSNLGDMGSGLGSRAASPKGRSRQTTGGTSGAGTGSPSSTGTTTTTQTVPLFEELTTYTRERNVASDGTARVNILTASAADMAAVGVPQRTAQWIVTNRTNPSSDSGINKITDLTGLFQSGFGSNSSGINASLLGQIADYLTDQSGTSRTNVVNLNTAPEEVLATIPNITNNAVSAILDARQSGTTFASMNEVFQQLSTLNGTEMAPLLEYGCVKSSVYIIRVRVRTASSSKIYAAQALVDLGDSTDATPKILQWREVPRSPGWSNWATAPTYTGGTTSPLNGL